MSRIHRWERAFLSATRLVSLVAVIASIAGALLMFYLGTENTIKAFTVQFQPPVTNSNGVPRDEAAVINLMVALDRFMIGIVLLFFGYGVYSLFIRPSLSSKQLGLPDWLHVTQIGQLKQTLAEVILVVLFVLFVRVALQTFHASSGNMSLLEIVEFLLLPVSILLLAGSLRLVELHPKPLRPRPDDDPEISRRRESDNAEPPDNVKNI